MLTPNKWTLIVSSVLITGLVGSGLWEINQRFNRDRRLEAESDTAVFAQTPPTPQEVLLSGEVRALPGKLDSIPVFNSNSPEWVKQEGILLSTFPPAGKKTPAAHLNFPFKGRFDLFAHHFTHTPKDLRTLYLGVVLQNPGTQTITVDVVQAASYLMQDAPYKEKPPLVDNPKNEVFSGPGNRAVTDVLQGQRQREFPAQLTIPPGESRLLLNAPIPVKTLQPPVNGRSTLMRLNSSGPVYAASLALFAPQQANGTERAPTLAEWQALLQNGGLAGPRDRAPTPPNQTSGQLIYSRVAGVAQGSTWKAQLSDRPNVAQLTIPVAGKAYSYALATLQGGTLGTSQIQTAKMLARYPDTAYAAHGNYGVEYNLQLPLYNPTAQAQRVTLTLQTPLKEEKLTKAGLRFRKPPLGSPFFRGSVRLQYTDDAGKSQNRYIHLWQRKGQVGQPLVTLNLPAGDRRPVQLDFIYPPDSTPPQVLTVQTLPQTSSSSQ